MSGSSPTAATPTRANAELGPGVGVAVSGGPDSLALLHVTWRVAQPLGLRVWALHVHHGLQPAADAWPQALRQECRRWAQAHPSLRPIEVDVMRLEGKPGKGQSVEEWAREGRQQALAELAHRRGLDLVLLAHHRRDQAETFLLQALRGAGPQGLAGMPQQHLEAGIIWVRPWLAHPRDAVRAVVQQFGLRPVHDPSNDDPRWARNRLRLQVWPALESAFEAAESGLAEAARQSARALPTLAAGAWGDLSVCTRAVPGAVLGAVPGAVSGAVSGAVTGDVRALQLDPQAWRELGGARRAQVLRLVLRQWGVRRPARTLVEAVCEPDGHVRPMRWPMSEGLDLCWYRHRLSLRKTGSVQGQKPEPKPTPKPKPEPLAVRFARAGRRRLDAWQGWLRLRRAEAGEPGLDGVLPLMLMVRGRAAGDQFQSGPRTVARSLKKQFQTAGVPAWARGAPLVCDEEGRVLMVPGLGMDGRVARPGGPWVLEWVPEEPPGAPSSSESCAL